MRSGWLKNFAAVSQHMRSKTNNAPRTCDFSLVLSKLQTIARNSEGFIMLFACAVIGRSTVNTCSATSFSQVTGLAIHIDKHGNYSQVCSQCCLVAKCYCFSTSFHYDGI